MKTRFIKVIMIAVLSLGQLELASAGGSEAAQTAMQAGMVAAGAAALAATHHAIPCQAFPKNPLDCVMMVLAVAQVGMSLMGSKGASQSATDMSSTYGNSAGTSTLGAPTSLAGGDTGSYQGITSATTAGEVAALNGLGISGLGTDYAKAKQDAMNSGISISPDGSTVTMPNGKSIPTSSLGSAAGMKADGFSDSQIAGAQAANDAAMKKAAGLATKVASLTNDAGGGGGGGGGLGSGSGGGGGAGGGDPFGTKTKLGGNKNDKGVAGMSKKFGNDNIGVSGDDIFEMVTRRYQAHDKANSFLKN